MDLCFECREEANPFGGGEQDRWPVTLMIQGERRIYHSGCIVKRLEEGSADLTLAPTEDLANELMNRFDNAIIALDRDAKEQGKKIYKTRWKGSHIRCMGLASVLQQQMFLDLDENNNEPLDAEEEET